MGCSTIRQQIRHEENHHYAVATIVVLGGASAGVYFLMPDWLPDSIRPKDPAHGKEAKKNEEGDRQT